MKPIKSISVYDAIIPNEGIGEIKLGMNSFYLRDFYKLHFTDKEGAFSSSFDKGCWKSELSSPFFQSLAIHYKDFLVIVLNLFSGEISHLLVKNGYKGKVFGLAGIEDSLRVFYSKYEKDFCEFEDGCFFFWINKKYGLSFFIDENLEDYPADNLFEKYLDLPIKEIEIFDNDQRIGIGEELPNKWKNKN